MNTTLNFLLLCFITAAVSGSVHAQPSSQDSKALIDAVEKGDREAVTALLNSGADINARWINNTPLEEAIFHQDVEMAKLLLDKGAKVQKGDLADAAHGSQGDKQKALALVTLLLARGADIRIDGADALRSASAANNIDVVKLLLAKGAKLDGPEAKDQSGNSVLLEAVTRDSLASVEALVAAGADVNARNDEQETVLMRAAHTDYRADTPTRIQLLKLLLEKGSDIKARSKNGRTALHFAADQIMSEAGGYQARPEIIVFLLEKGVDVNAKDDDGETVLMETAKVWHGTLVIPQLLIAKGADVNLANNDGVTVLMLAAQNNRADLAQLLLEKGARIDAKDKLGKTAIVHATEAGQPEVVALLANKGADLSLTPYKSEAELKAAMHKFMLVRAVSYRKVEDVKRLLSSGVDPNSRDANGNPALTLACTYSTDTDVVKALLEGGANVNITNGDGNTALMLASAGNSRDVVQLLLDHQASVNLKNNSQKTALLFAAEEGHTQVAKLLIDKGADVSVRDADGRTALLLTSMSEYAQEELIQLLLEHKADINATDSKGNTALMLAARAEAFQAIEPLVAAGSQVNAKNNDGWTALRNAREAKRVQEDKRAETIRLLIKAGAKE